MSVHRIYNFSAGPAVLPVEVLEEAQRDLVALPGVGMSVMEISHRSKPFDEIIQGAEADLRTLGKVPDNYKVLFLQGGASLQFSAVPMNLLTPGASADYIITGDWSKKALKEAKKIGATRVAASAEAGGFKRIPLQNELELAPGAAYAHMTSNNTIVGTEFKYVPDTGNAPLVNDASSNIFSRPIDVSKFGLIYAGAQKNLGPSGLVVVIVRKDLVEGGRKDIPTIFQYRIHAENNSLYNTPPTFSVYLLRNVLDDVKKNGGLVAMEKRNREKAQLLYDVMDARSDFYGSPVEKAARSTMNVVFTLKTPELEAEFLAEAQKRKMVGLKGHRSVGGMRASIYNAVLPEWVKSLADFMREFKA